MQQIIQQPFTSALHIGICLIKPSRIPRIPDRSGTSDEGQQQENFPVLSSDLIGGSFSRVKRIQFQ